MRLYTNVTEVSRGGSTSVSEGSTLTCIITWEESEEGKGQNEVVGE